MKKNNKKNNEKSIVKNNHRKKFLVPASKLPQAEKVEDFRSTAQWRIFRIMSEFIDGFQFLADFKNPVTIFGSARYEPDNVYYKEAHRLGYLLAKDGYAVITGGGPGIMEAGNKGAYEADGHSIGFNIQLPMEQRINEFVNKPLGFHYFFTRKVMMAYSSRAYVYFPGGFGTLDEFFEIITLIQTRKIETDIPVICVGKDFWDPIMKLIDEGIYQKYTAIDKEDMNIYHVVDSAEEAFKIIKKFTKGKKERKIQH